jgi:transcriptional regulator with XRE-family HTH domain
MKIKTIKVQQIDSGELFEYIGLRIKALRMEKKITQQDLATRWGMTRTSLTNAEKGAQHIPLDKLYNLALILGCEITELLP